MIPLEPTHFHCPECGWQETIPFYRSDDFHEGIDHFTFCPQCGNRDIETRPPTRSELILAERKWKAIMDRRQSDITNWSEILTEE